MHHPPTERGRALLVLAAAGALWLSAPFIAQAAPSALTCCDGRGTCTSGADLTSCQGALDKLSKPAPRAELPADTKATKDLTHKKPAHRCAHGLSAARHPATRLFVVNGCDAAEVEAGQAPYQRCSLAEVTGCAPLAHSAETLRAEWPLLGDKRSYRRIEPGVLEMPIAGRTFWITVDDQGLVRRAAAASEDSCSR